MQAHNLQCVILQGRVEEVTAASRRNIWTWFTAAALRIFGNIGYVSKKTLTIAIIKIDICTLEGKIHVN